MFSSLCSWIRLLRLPAVLTVPGDIWVGAALCGQEISLIQTLSVCLLYLYGMGLNDLLDVAQDREHKPNRPLPSGQIREISAWVFCLLAVILACVLQPEPPTFLLFLLITAYNCLKNLHLGLAAVLMASCRGVVLWIGAGAPSDLRPLIPALLLWGLLIAGITLLADVENRECRWSRLGAGGMTLIWCSAPLIGLWMGQPHFLVFLPWALLALLGLQNYAQIKGQGQMKPQNTGKWLAMLIPLQSAFLFATAPLWQGAAILSLFPLLKWSLRLMRIS